MGSRRHEFLALAYEHIDVQYDLVIHAGWQAGTERQGARELQAEEECSHVSALSLFLPFGHET